MQELAMSRTQDERADFDAKKRFVRFHEVLDLSECRA